MMKNLKKENNNDDRNKNKNDLKIKTKNVQINNLNKKSLVKDAIMNMEIFKN